MGIVNVKRVSNRLGDRMRGRCEVVEIKPTPNPFQKKQWIQATITLSPATFTQKAQTKIELFHGTFMDVIQKVQVKYPKKPASYKTLDTTPDWAKPKEPAPAKES